VLLVTVLIADFLLLKEKRKLIGDSRMKNLPQDVKQVEIA